MPNVKDCPGFESFGADVQQAREAAGMSRRELAERVGIAPRYLANIELCGTIPSMPVVMQLIRLCKLPAERYFNPGLIREDSEQRQWTSHKLQLCPEKYLPIVEGVIDGAIKLNEIDGKTEGE
ncbi:helix-turn-helix domain-containing protein [Dorea sp. AGR2135]|uniref:helix-turn-helix domain-containing protein n=1 Tax=Dorea sp. AGR2135 TaxID=1280669 RepID=UPI0004135778|nr:helix-turn-helix transcriptional regulator [Dorea sp. AGR2135]